ncbi:MAG: SprT-like domain-containing protein [Hyphomicrobiaceae bacterium]
MAITKSPPPRLAPAVQAIHELQLAHDFLKAALWKMADWSPCFITLQRKGSRTLGYFAPARFATAEGQVADEIALNPRHIGSRSFIEVMSTLGHEMCHAWQHHCGRKHSRGGYHNKEWAGEMLRVGLHPSHSGSPGGRMTGQKMSHYVIRGGVFEVAVAKLRAMVPELTWFDVNAAELLPKGLPDADLVTPRRGRTGRRTVYRCLACRLRAESRSDALLICGKCETQMVPVGLR